jgi:hypothetical protein
MTRGRIMLFTSSPETIFTFLAFFHLVLVLNLIIPGLQHSFSTFLLKNAGFEYVLRAIVYIV